MTQSAALQTLSASTPNRDLRFVRWLRPFQIDLRALAVMRIILGLSTFYDALSRFSLLRAFYTDDGVSPRSAFLNGPLKWQSFYSVDGSYGWAVFLLTAYAVLALLFTIGFRTRIASIVLLALLWSLVNRNPTLSHGGNSLVIWMLIWSQFVPVNAVASVDACTARRRPRSRRVASIGTAAMLLQIAFVYWLAFAAKTSADWRSDFTAVYYFLNSHLATPLGYAIGQLPLLSQLLTIASLGLELIGPLFALMTFSMPRTRTAIVLAFILFHLGLVATMYVGTFSFICIGAWMIYIPTPMWDAFARGSIVRAFAGVWNSMMAGIARMVESVPGLAVRAISSGPKNAVAQIGVALMLVYVCIVNLVGTLPTPVAPLAGPLARLPRLKQSWGMMDSSWKYFHALVLEVEQADGTIHPITRADAPDGSFDRTLPTTQKPDEYWRWPVWRAENTWLVAYRSTLVLGVIEKKPASMEGYCDFFYRKWNEFHPSPGQKARVVRAYMMMSSTRPPNSTRNNAVPVDKHLLYTWPKPGTSPSN